MYLASVYKRINMIIIATIAHLDTPIDYNSVTVKVRLLIFHLEINDIYKTKPNLTKWMYLNQNFSYLNFSFIKDKNKWIIKVYAV
jgi:hypothetical protein